MGLATAAAAEWARFLALLEGQTKLLTDQRQPPRIPKASMAPLVRPLDPGNLK